MDGEIIKATFKKTNRVRTAPQWRYNHGQTLVFENVDLPEVYEVHFSNSIDGEAKTCLGGPNGVQIPSEYFIPGCEIYAWIFVTEGDVGITKKEVIIPIESRARPTDQEPLPEERTIIDQTVSKLNEVINDIPNVIEEALTEAKESGEFDGPKGDKGDPFTYNDFTPEQLEALTGPKGDPFTYEDFTPEQLESLRGPKGDPFTYEDFTPEQLEDLQGPEGSTIWTTTHSYSKPVVDGRYYFANSHLTGPAGATKKIGDLVVMSNSTDGEYKCFSIRNFLYDGVLIDTKFVCNMQGPAGNDGVSPTVRTVAIDGGTRVIITDVNGPHWFDVMNGSGSDDSEIVYFYGTLTNSAVPTVTVYNYDFYKLRDDINAGKTPIAVIKIPALNPAKDSRDQPIANEKEVLVMTLAEWCKDKADLVPGQGDTVPLYHGTYARFVAQIQNDMYTLELAHTLTRPLPITYDWRWILTPTKFATAGEVDQNVVYFGFEYDGSTVYDDGGYSVSTSCLPSDIIDAINNNYAVYAKYVEDGVTYVLPLTNATDTYGEFAAYIRLPVIDAQSPDELASVYRLSIDYYIDRFNDGIVDDMEGIWRVYWREVIEGSGDMSAYRTAADQDLIDNNLSDAIGAKYTKPLAGIPKADLASAVQTSLGKADTALQSYTETDPTVPSWAKQSSKPSYTASEVGAVAVSQGVSHAGEFVVVGSDGNITTVTMTAWQGGSY